MLQIRPEVQRFAIDCEKLLGSYIEPPLTKDEKALIAYYVQELTQQFDSERRKSPAV